MKALVIGATGATGKDLVKQLLNDNDFDEVNIFVRKPVDVQNDKLKVHVVNFEKPEEWKDKVQGDVAFSCLGTTLKDAGSKEAQRKVDFDYQYEFAKAAKENEVDDYILVSSYGADPTSKIFYSKMKGELEEAVKQLHFTKITIFKPGMLERKDSERTGEVLGSRIIKFANKLGLLESQKPLPTDILAKAMINSSKIKSNGYSSIKLGNIFCFAEKSNA
ncbi:NAD-dependent epimerase/dehydratase family protein [Chryseobacterium carnipullorum]|uniref:NAD-dependent epimerase/dehydratase family protein n=1 Tax=Chryseobacterium carnipullorum TaxID=1124835 RepID=A0A376DWE8_CHRCU|nr:NAD(P)H-binding protein [Chryseobacterium carnipullorum]AZA50065.1 NAD-dependent epimerase/dehydratase family protein [Chryseobacterium carnipullorum]AZA64943.1 NAD-dependent epimerase/dehydratase family protein [Chryseobacterium carnipullorum]STC96967.1 Putative NADH-flavin reductase [Chryseobacterium carnipullorum]HBV17748.1 semialdehyde dehydrogenase [Chryseobacterium carnipullorum]